MKDPKLFPHRGRGGTLTFSDTPPSDDFAFFICSEGSTCDKICDLCGSVHFHDTSVNMEEGELEKLLAKSKEDPNKYIAHSDEPHWGMIDGMAVVLHCPCNGLRLYENFILANRRLICGFLIKRTEENLEAASRDHTDAKLASAAVETFEP